MNAAAGLIMDGATGKVVFEFNSHSRRAPASLTKIMTAIVAFERGNLSEKVRVKNMSLPQEAAMGLWPGDVLTLEDLLWGLLLPSGNDAAEVIADYVGGSTENFVRMMNEKAAQLGLKDTHFVNPHGLDEDGHYSSAYDLAVMARYALNNALFARMVASQTHVVQASRTFYLQNYNYLLRPSQGVPGADGVKTGYTDDAGDSLVGSVSRDGRRIITVTLGAGIGERTSEAIKLINYAFSSFTWVDLKLPPFWRIADLDGQRRPVVLKGSPAEMVPLAAEAAIRASIRPILRLNRNAAASSTSLVGNPPSLASMGTVTFYVADSPLVELPVSVP